MRFVYLDSRFTLHASSPRSVALTQLRFACLAVASLAGDLHPEECAHAGSNDDDFFSERGHHLEGFFAFVQIICVRYRGLVFHVRSVSRQTNVVRICVKFVCESVDRLFSLCPGCSVAVKIEDCIFCFWPKSIQLFFTAGTSTLLLTLLELHGIERVKVCGERMRLIVIAWTRNDDRPKDDKSHRRCKSCRTALQWAKPVGEGWEMVAC